MTQVLLAVMLVLAPGAHGSTAEAPETVGAEAPDAEAVARRLRGALRRLEARRELNDKLGQGLQELHTPTTEELAQATEEHDRMRQRMAKAAESTGQPVDELMRDLERAKRERDALVQRQTALSAEDAPTGRGLRQEIVLAGKTAIGLRLVRNRVVPLAAPYFSVRQARGTEKATGRIVDVVVISREKDGEGAKTALGPNGILANLIAKSDPKTSYFSFAVCADSIEAFYTVAEAVSRKGFAYAWDTAKDEDIIRSRADFQRQQQDTTPHSTRGYESGR